MSITSLTSEIRFLHKLFQSLWSNHIACPYEQNSKNIFQNIFFGGISEETVIQFWNNMRLSKFWFFLFLWVNYPFKFHEGFIVLMQPGYSANGCYTNICYTDSQTTVKEALNFQFISRFTSICFLLSLRNCGATQIKTQPIVFSFFSSMW